MKFDKTGIIIYTIHYKKCVEFYGNILELPKLFEKESLTCFQFGASYLMVEVDDQYKGSQKESTRTKTCLRMNVENVKKEVENLRAKNVEVDYQEHTWGTVAKFLDPDGNMCAFKDNEKFEKQIDEYKSN